MSSSKQETVLADVESGDKTGIYYIPLCNLPFGTTWQALKDWARKACDIDHVAVFPSSTSAWVRVLGKGNFDSAWSHLEGGNFNGRAIIASNKNATEPIKIKELTNEPSSSRARASNPSSSRARASNPSSSRARAPSPSSPRARAPSPSSSRARGSKPWFSRPRDSRLALTSWRSSLTSQPSSNQDSQPESSTSQQQYGNNYPEASAEQSCSAQPVATHSYSASGHGSTAPSASQVCDQTDAVGCYADTSVYDQGNAGSAEHSAAGQGDDGYGGFYDENGDLSGYGYVETEARKILVTNIDHKLMANDVASWLRRKVGDYATQIVDIELPRNQRKRQLRGHAYMVFQSSRAANKAIERLNGRMYSKRTLAARLTIEGVTPLVRDYATYAATEDEGPIVADGSSGKRPDRRA